VLPMPRGIPMVAHPGNLNRGRARRPSLRPVTLLRAFDPTRTTAEPILATALYHQNGKTAAIPRSRLDPSQERTASNPQCNPAAPPSIYPYLPTEHPLLNSYLLSAPERSSLVPGPGSNHRMHALCNFACRRGPITSLPTPRGPCPHAALPDLPHAPCAGVQKDPLISDPHEPRPSTTSPFPPPLLHPLLPPVRSPGRRTFLPDDLLRPHWRALHNVPPPFTQDLFPGAERLMYPHARTHRSA
jgi:hypothetical protein